MQLMKFLLILVSMILYVSGAHTRMASTEKNANLSDVAQLLVRYLRDFALGTVIPESTNETENGHSNIPTLSYLSQNPKVFTKARVKRHKRQCPDNFGPDITKTKCSRLPGTRCDICCKMGQILVLSRPLMCLENGSWSEKPKCEATAKNITCPELDSDVIITNCNMHVGTTCTVGCDEPKSLEGPEEITCLASGKWSDEVKCVENTPQPPLESCPTPELPENVILGPGCSLEDGSECSVKCNEGYNLIGSDTITCTDGNWSTSPTCKENERVTCPEFGEDVILKDCSRKTNTECQVECDNGKTLIGPDHLKCLITGMWSSDVECVGEPSTTESDEDIQINKCKQAEMPKDMLFVPSSCKTSGQKTCKIGCKAKVFNGGPKPIKIVFIKQTECLPSGEWSNLPNCTEAKYVYWDQRILERSCQEPELSDNMVISGNCSKLPGSECYVLCDKGYDMIGPSKITCTNKNWSPLPECKMKKIKKCPEEIATDIVMKDCSRLVDSECDVECAEGKSLVGPSRLTCLSSGDWSSSVQCIGNVETTTESSTGDALNKCQSEEMPEDMKFIPEDCKTSGNMECKIGCKTKVFNGGAKPMKIVFIRKSECLPTGTWSNLPNCTAAKYKYWDERILESSCQEPMLPEHTVLVGNCSRFPGSECFLGCDGGYDLVGPPKITCTDKKWSLIPTCKLKKRCPEVAGPQVKLKDCDRHVNSECEVECSNGGALVGPSRITCLPTGDWSASVECVEIPTTTTESSTEEPEYLETCRNAKMQERLIFVSKECKQDATRNCTIGCKIKVFNGGPRPLKLIDVRESYCLPTGEWSNQPNCTMMKYRYWDLRIKKNSCPEPELSDNLQIVGNCSKLPFTDCALTCEKGYELMGPTTITCRRSKWSELPTCKLKQQKMCPESPGPGVVLSTCSRLESAECDVQCEEDKTLVGPSRLTCMGSGEWSAFVKCIDIPTTTAEDYYLGKCRTAKMPKDVYFMNETCQLDPTKKCRLACEVKYFNNGDPRWVWSYLRKTPKSSCLPTGEWNNMPNCTRVQYNIWDRPIKRQSCRDPELPDNLQIVGNCSKLPFTDCALTCDKGYELLGPNTITCTNRTWSELPNCKLKQGKMCPESPGPGVALSVCSRLESAECDVACEEEGKTLVGPSRLTCMGSGEWSDMVECTEATSTTGEPEPEYFEECRMAKMPKDVYFVNKTCKLDPTMKCKLSCKVHDYNNGTPRWGLGRVRQAPLSSCLPTGEWNHFPNCTLIQYHFWDVKLQQHSCSDLKLSPNLKIVGNCSNLPDSECEFACTEGYHLTGSNIMTCKKKHWSEMPICRIERELLGVNQNTRKK